MTDEITEVLLKRIFDKLDSIEATLHEQCKRISKVEALNEMVSAIWKKIVASVGIASTVIGLLVIFS